MSSTRKRRLRGDQGSRRYRDRSLSFANRLNLPRDSSRPRTNMPRPGCPASADLHRLGVVCHSRGDYETAMTLLAKAIQLSPNQVQYYHDLCTTLLAAGRYEETLAISSAALEIDSTFAPAVDLRAQLLHRVGRTDEAIVTYERFIDRGLASAEIHNNYASIFHESGRCEEAIGAYEAALRLDPSHVEAYFNLSDLARSGRYVFTTSQVASMEKIAERDDLLAESHARLCFAIGVAYDRSLQNERAFGWFQKGNETVLTQQEVLYTQSLHERHLRAHSAINHVATKLVGSLPTVSEFRSATPIFIVGMPRSGTTLMAEILSMHPDVQNAGEVDDLRPRLERCVQQQMGDPAWSIQGGLFTAFTEYRQALARAQVGQPRYIIDKTPENLLLLGLICQMLPDARVIWMRRDSRDVCWSCYTQCFRSERLAATTADLLQLRDYESYCRTVGEQWWDNGLVNGLRVNYEQLVASPEVMVRQVLEVLELPWDSGCLRFHKNRSVVRTASTLQVRQPLHRKSVGGWRRYERHLASVWGVDELLGCVQ